MKSRDFPSNWNSLQLQLQAGCWGARLVLYHFSPGLLAYSVIKIISPADHKMKTYLRDRKSCLILATLELGMGYPVFP